MFGTVGGRGGSARARAFDRPEGTRLEATGRPPTRGRSANGSDRSRLAAFTAALLVTALASSLPGSGFAQEPLFDLLVSNNEGHSVRRFDWESGRSLGDLVRPGAGGLGRTQEVLLGHDGSLLVSGFLTSAILAYDARTGAFLREFTTGYTLQQPTKTRFGPDGDLYVSQWGPTQTSVAVFDGDSGAFIREATPDLDRPMGQAWDADGVLHVTSFGSRDVRSFDADGNLIDVVVGTATLQGPVNVWFEDDEMRVIDWSSGTIQRFDLDGTFLGMFTTGLSNPEGWAYGPDGALYVAEWTGNRVRRIDPETGVILGSLATGAGLQSPNDVFFIERFPDFSLSATEIPVKLSAGSTESITLLVRPERGVAFDAPVALTCASPSARLSCTVTPATVTPGTDTVMVSVVLSAAAAASAPATPTPGPRTPTPPGLLLLMSMAAVLWAASRRRQGLRRCSAAVAAVAALSGGCGDSTTEPTPTEVDVEQVTITGTGDGLTRSVALTVEIR